MKDSIRNIIIHTLLPIFGLGLLISGLWFIGGRKNIGFYIFAGLAIFFVFILSGLRGPRPLKNILRSYQVWSRTKAVPFFPIDPYKPIDTSLKEGVKAFLPTKERIINWLIVRIILFIIGVLVIIIFLKFLK